ncbi:MAG: YjjW family glycine radical enzyme activase [Erysipelotrichaceae bacterium]|nr:YjjW family glycine radical enzyme activase [Erysipelotrichaceae bacterium]
MSTNMIAPINKIIPFSNVDGPGNRLAIFFQSCPFRCLYCHNPETINMCNHCGICVDTCPTRSLTIKNNKVLWDDSTCINCDTCIKVCPYLSSPKIKYMDIETVIKHIEKAKPFIVGITVSGGECTNHPEFLTTLFKEVKKLGLTTFMDTNGHHDLSLFPELLAHTDGIMLDVKAFDQKQHYALTNKDNVTVLKNLNYLLEKNKLYEVRTVLLHDHQRNIDTVENVSRIIKDKCYYKLIKYRPFGVRVEGLKICGDNSVDDAELSLMKKIAETNGANRIITV